MYLLDVNVWLALAFDSHRHHVSAAAWFDSAPDESCCFCRLTQMGFLRIATTPRLMMERALQLNEAWQIYDQLYEDPRVVYIEEPAGVEPAWRAFTQRQTFSPKLWNDAYVAAFAGVAGLEVITFDKGFAQYTGLQSTILA
mgnify:CR=1 FL=1